MLRVIGILALVWLGFMLLGAMLKFLVSALMIGALLGLAAFAYAALRGGDDSRLLH